MGLLFALSACLVWGLIFVVPLFLADFTPMEITLGRYLCYGLFSLALFLKKGTFHLRRYPLKIWGTVLIFALVSNVLYYVAIVFGVRYATAPVTVLLLGMCPLLVAFYGNWHSREIAFKSLMVPALCIAFGLVMVNVSEIDWGFSLYSPRQYVWGLLAVVWGIVWWSWYAVQNARFLKKNSDISRGDWSTLIGVGSLFWVVIFGLVLLVMPAELMSWGKLVHFSTASLYFWTGALLLGVLSSWVGCYLWNHASTQLPLSLMGMLIICETIFSLTFVFLYQRRLPSLWEFIGIIVMVGGIFSVMWALRKTRLRAQVQKIPTDQT